MPNHNLYLEAIKSYSAQFNQTFFEVTKTQIPQYENITDIVIAGMGGSIFGGKFVDRVFGTDKLLVPLKILSNYELPAYADENTLVIVTSFSGNTEEAVSVYNEAQKIGCNLFVITGGGILGNEVKTKKVAGYVFETKNGSKYVPRTGIGYEIGATLGLLSDLDLLLFSEKDALDLIDYIHNFTETTLKNERTTNNISQKLIQKIPVFISAEHLFTGAYIWRNFMNETAKHIGFSIEIPDLNHHLLDGLLFPKTLQNNLIFILLQSNLYHPRIQKRFKITRDILNKQRFLNISLELGGKSREKDVWETIVLGSLISYNLARIYGVNPSSNEMVDYLKKQLGTFTPKDISIK